MKKFLSLVLALVMTMSLVTISAGAKDYADADKITYVEAVDVLSALGVLEGDANGFRPTDTLKRSEAAKIICALNLTPKTATSLTADAAPFADVAKTHWAAGYIAEGVDSGILAGVGGNKFDPDGQLIGYAYLKMLLVSLGYDAAAEELTGANWSVNVAKLAKKAGLTKGNDDFVGTKAVTREEAALYALNTLQAKTVEYENKGTNITINGVVIASGASQAKYVTDKDGKYVLYKAENYGKLVKTEGDDTVDAYGRPAIVWTYKGEEVGTYADKAVVSFTAETEGKDIKAALKAEGYKKTSVGGKIVDITDDTFAKTKNGDLVEFFGKEDENKVTGKVTNVIYAVTTVKTELAQVTDFTKDKTSTKDTDERAIKTTKGTVLVKDKLVANFDELFDELKEDDYVLITKATAGEDSGKIITMAIPETIEGKLTAVTSSKITVDGETYGIAGIASSDDFKASKKAQTIWLDSYGYAVKGEEKGGEKSDAVYLVSLFDAADKYGTKTYYAQVVDAEGEVKELALAADKLTIKNGKVTNLTTQKLYTYTTNSDDEATLSPLKAADYIDIKGVAIKADAAKVAGQYFADEVTFVYVDGSNAKLKVSVSNKVEKVTRAADGSFAVLDSDGKYVETVFIGKKAEAIVDSSDLVFVKSTSEVGTALDDEDKTGVTYSFYKDGDKMTEIASGIEDVGFYTYSVNSTTGRYTLTPADDTTTITKIVKDKYMTLANKKVDVLLDADAEIYDLSDNNISSLGELSDLLDEGEKLTAHVVYDTKDEVVTLIYIV